MARLTTCRDCGQAMSRNARACPHCGRPGTRETIFKTALGLICFGAIAAVAVTCRQLLG